MRRMTRSTTSASARVGARVRAVGLALAVAIALPACVHASTHVERGEAFTTGQASYDEFFAKVHALHEQAGRARESADLARSALSRRS